MPILVCLTFGDKLYAEHMTDDGGHPRASDMAKVIKSQVTVSYNIIVSRIQHLGLMKQGYAYDPCYL